MKRERLFYLDFVRAIAAISIVITHYNAGYLWMGQENKAVLTLEVGGLYIGDWGVSLFLIISGAALMYVYEEKCELKKFFKKRFLSIYPMFWIAYVVYLAYYVLVYKNIPGAGTIAPWRIIFSVIGFDGLLVANGIQTFYLLGEWFLGVIVLIYLLFPLLRKLANEKPVLLLVLTAISYAGGAVLCRYGPFPLVLSTCVLVRLPEVVFGMMFVKYRKKVNWKAALAALLLVAANQILQPEIPRTIQTTVVGIASFIVLVYVSEFVKFRPVEYICSVLSKYSYAIFLVHHVIIDQVIARVDRYYFTVRDSYVMFIVLCVPIAVCAFGLYHVHAAVMKLPEKLKQRGRTDK
ncbi:MAG: acyltransferase [Schaedlerella sp.]|nr:acyltransferase [Lachnospiraceae bacterium]MDY4202638.1 acyltransferase [Schaedlerella sp.]